MIRHVYFSAKYPELLFFWLFFWIYCWLCCSLHDSEEKYPICAYDAIGNGSWVESSLDREEYLKHLVEVNVDGAIEEAVNDVYKNIPDSEKTFGISRSALMWKEVWEPYNCSYHRFHTASAKVCAEYTAKKFYNDSAAVLPIVILGDSGTRDWVCGLSRILNGNELFGPNSPDLCLLPHNEGLREHVYRFEIPNIRIFEAYVRTFDYHERIDWVIEDYLMQRGDTTYFNRTKPYAIVVNTGAWDFDNFARRSKDHQTYLKDECENPEEQEISDARNSQVRVFFINFVTFIFFDNGKYIQKTKEKLKRLSELAELMGTRLIYRNSHYNFRYGAKCADEELEKFLRNETIFEIL